MASSGDSIITIFQKHLERIDKLLDDLDGDLTVESSSFDLEKFWKDFTSAIQLLSHEASKLCVVFSKPPFPSIEDIDKLTNDFMTVVETIVSIFFSLPVSIGAVLTKQINLFVTDVVKSVRQLCRNIKNPNNQQLQSVGNVWEKCEAIEKLPKDNKEAVVKVFEEELLLVEDAVNELTYAIEQNVEDHELLNSIYGQNGLRIERNENWTETELRTVHPSLGLIKAYKACLKRTMGAISDNGNGADLNLVGEFDNIVHIIEDGSCSVDNLVLSLYPPSERAVMQHNLSTVRNLCKQLLETFESSHFCSEPDKARIEFLHHAVDHNYTAARNESVV